MRNVKRQGRTADSASKMEGKKRACRIKKMQAQARTGVRATAPMHVPVAVSCCFKNILAPDIPMYKADGLVKMPLVRRKELKRPPAVEL